MPALHVRDVDDAVMAALKARAERNRRSVQKEVLQILEDAVRATDAPVRRPLRLKTVRVGSKRSFSRDEIYRDDS